MGFCPSVLLKFFCLFLCFCTIVLLCSFMVIGRRKRQARASGAPQLRKFGNLSIRKKFCYDVSVQSNADHTDSGGGGRESGVSTLGEEYVIAELKFCILSTPIVSAVNHMTTRAELLKAWLALTIG